MRKVMVKSVHDAFEYVMGHYYPFGLEDNVEKRDTYAVISIQDSHLGGFGIEFKENQFCTGVLTLEFDDIERPVKGAILFTQADARQIIEFIKNNRKADTLLVHDYAAQSRSLAVGAFAFAMLGGNNAKFFRRGSPNMWVYDTLMSLYDEM